MSLNYGDISGYDFENSATIRPPAAADLVNYKVLLFVDSRDRDITAYPSPSSYDVVISNPLANVASCRMLSSEILLRRENVSIGSNSATSRIASSGTTMTVSLPPGMYSATEICAALGDVGVIATYDAETRRFAFTSTEPLTLDLTSSDSMWPVLGLSQSTFLISPPPLTLKSTSPAELDGRALYCAMNIDGFKSVRSECNEVDDAFAVIDARFDRVDADQPALANKHFNPAIAHLARLRVSFNDRFGNPYPFPVKDHHYMLEFTCIKNKRFAH